MSAAQDAAESSHQQLFLTEELEEEGFTAIPELSADGVEKRIVILPVGETTANIDDDDIRTEYSNTDDEQRQPHSVTEEKNCRQIVSQSAANSVSLFHDFNLIRDFFFNAFSDGNQDAYCCGEDGFMTGSSCCNNNRRARVAPDNTSATKSNMTAPVKSSASSVVSQKSAATSNSAYPNIQNAASYESGKKRKKKPLAIAVGFNYAEDMNGRPVFVTPGRRMHMTNSNNSFATDDRSHRSQQSSSRI